MPRHKRPRWISEQPEITGMLPQGMQETGETTMSLEEFEAIKLIDYQGFNQAQAAVLMNISRQTFGRILKQARYRFSEALVTGKKLVIAGGCYKMGGSGQHRRSHGGK